MPENKESEQARIIGLLEKMLIFQLYSLNVPKDRIAKIVGKQNSWVHDLLRGIKRFTDKKEEPK